MNLRIKLIKIRNQFTIKTLGIYKVLISYKNIGYFNNNKRIINNKSISISNKLNEYFSKESNHRYTMSIASYLRLFSGNTCVTFVVQALNNVGEKVDSNVKEINDFILFLQGRNFIEIENFNDIMPGDIVVEKEHTYIFQEINDNNILRVIDNQRYGDIKIKKSKYYYDCFNHFCVITIKCVIFPLSICFILQLFGYFVYIDILILSGICFILLAIEFLFNKTPRKRLHIYKNDSRIFRKTLS